MQASDVCYQLIKEFEKLRLRPYLCPAKKWTVGYGSTYMVDPAKVITTDEANQRLIKDVEEVEKALRRLLKVPTSQQQFDALVSWVFNVGEGNARTSTLLRLFNSGLPCSVHFLSWNKATLDGRLVVLRGLTRRRVTERRLFDTGLLAIEP